VIRVFILNIVQLIVFEFDVGMLPELRIKRKMNWKLFTRGGTGRLLLINQRRKMGFK